MSAFKPLIGGSDFEEFRQNKYTYVDKTGFLNDFLDVLTTKVALFTRPRRFGKTLFMSMLASFFDRTKDSHDLFTGLKVAANAELCEQWMNQYPVVFLTFKDVEGADFEEAIVKIHYQIRQYCSLHKYLLTSERVKDTDKRDIQHYLSDEIDENKLGRSLQVLTRALSCHYEKSPIVLIDEYDTPIAKANEYGYHDKMNMFELSFLSKALKDNPFLNFAVLTGCLCFTNDNRLNCIRHFDIAHYKYADVFGFTQTEVEQLLVDAGCEEKRETIRDWYDGYHFGKRQDIYCPWSILCYLEDVRMQGPQTEPKAYWVNTSANELPKAVLTRHPNAAKARSVIASLLAGIPVRVELNPWMTLDDVSQKPDSFWTLLYQTGYLTRVADPEEYVDGNPDTDFDDLGDGMGWNTAFLVIPNGEVRRFFGREFRAWLADIFAGNTDRLRKALCDALRKGDAAEIEQAVSAVLAECEARSLKGASLFGVLYTLLWLGYPATTSVSGDGGLDMVVTNRRERCAAVLKVRRIPSETTPQAPERTLETSVGAALEQMEGERCDGRLRKDGYARILHVGIAFRGTLVKAGVRLAPAGGQA